MYETDGTADYKAVEKTFWGNWIKRSDFLKF
jgi:hypothetical protein